MNLDQDKKQGEGPLREVSIMRMKVALVLGEIGDERALSVLDKLQDPKSGSALLEIEGACVKEAIRRIKEKSR